MRIGFGDGFAQERNSKKDLVFDGRDAIFIVDDAAAASAVPASAAAADSAGVSEERAISLNDFSFRIRSWSWSASLYVNRPKTDSGGRGGRWV